MGNPIRIHHQKWVGNNFPAGGLLWLFSHCKRMAYLKDKPRRKQWTLACVVEKEDLDYLCIFSLMRTKHVLTGKGFPPALWAPSSWRLGGSLRLLWELWQLLKSTRQRLQTSFLVCVLGGECGRIWGPCLRIKEPQRETNRGVDRSSH